MRRWLIDTSETDAVACIAPAGFTGSRDLDNLTAPQAVVSSDRISKLDPRKLRLLQAAATVSDCHVRTRWINIHILSLQKKLFLFRV